MNSIYNKSTTMSKTELQKRYTKNDNDRMRIVTNDNGEKFFEGYPIVFNQRSKLLAENGRVFYEVIKPEAVRNSLNKNVDIPLTYNHDEVNKLPLARFVTGRDNNTMEYSIDDFGVFIRAKISETTLSQDLSIAVERGDVDGMSFIFGTLPNGEGEEVSRMDDGNLLVTVNDMAFIREFTITNMPAYPDTSISVSRSLDEFEENEKKKENEYLIELELDKDRLRLSNLK